MNSPTPSPFAPQRAPYSRTQAPCEHRATPLRSRFAALRYGPVQTRVPAWVKRLAAHPCDPAKGDA